MFKQLFITIGDFPFVYLSRNVLNRRLDEVTDSCLSEIETILDNNSTFESVKSDIVKNIKSKEFKGCVELVSLLKKSDWEYDIVDIEDEKKEIDKWSDSLN